MHTNMLYTGENAGEEAVILTDILGLEDALGTMDFKVAGNETGISAFQLDIKSEGLTLDILERALAQVLDCVCNYIYCIYIVFSLGVLVPVCSAYTYVKPEYVLSPVVQLALIIACCIICIVYQRMRVCNIKKQAKKGRLDIIAQMRTALAGPRPLKDCIPKILSFHVEPEWLGEFLVLLLVFAQVTR